MQWRPHSKLSRYQYTSQQIFIKNSFFPSLSFCMLCKNHYNLRIHAPIWLKFGTHIGGLKANNSIDFGANLINIHGLLAILCVKQS